MIDRTDLQLAMIERICEMDTQDLIDFFPLFTGCEVVNVNEDGKEEEVTLELDDACRLKKMLSHFLYVLGEHVEISEDSRPGLKAMLDAVVKGEIEVLLCSDLTRLTSRLSPEFIGAIQRVGVNIVTVDGSEISGQKPNDE